VIRVYPPARVLYFGAITSTIFLTDFGLPIRETMSRREVMVPAFAVVINFSTKGRISFAFASVVVILPAFIKLDAKERIRARR
jgi:hypothetical protein